jgi:hypothetical protein
MRALGNAPGISLLGTEANIDVDPVRDVLISLLGNLGAWVVGVFFAYVAHDHDPEYMESARERDQARAAYYRVRKGADARIESERARLADEIKKKETTVETYKREFKKPYELLLQVREREQVIGSQVQSMINRTSARYRDALLQIAMDPQREITFVIASDGRTISPYEYKNMPIKIDADFVRTLT